MIPFIILLMGVTGNSVGRHAFPFTTFLSDGLNKSGSFTITGLSCTPIAMPLLLPTPPPPPPLLLLLLLLLQLLLLASVIGAAAVAATTGTGLGLGGIAVIDIDGMTVFVAACGTNGGGNKISWAIGRVVAPVSTEDLLLLAGMGAVFTVIIGVIVTGVIGGVETAVIVVLLLFVLPELFTLMIFRMGIGGLIRMESLLSVLLFTGNISTAA